MSVCESGSQIWEAVVCQAIRRTITVVQSKSGMERYSYNRPKKSISVRSRDWCTINVEVHIIK